MYKITLFQRRGQLAGVYVSAYTGASRKLAPECNLQIPLPSMQQHDKSTVLALNEMLRDKFVRGLSDSHIHERHFAQRNLCLKTAYHIAPRAGQ